MAEFGYSLSSEEHPPLDLVRYARQAEQAGFDFAMISDHYHPWLDQQGNSPFVWSVIGGISQVTQTIRIGTGVTCPIMRIHPAIIAQAAATAASMLPGRFLLGLGSGENLNEHILGEHWPPVEIRHEMLDEAVEIIRLLFQPGEHSYWGDYFTVENARLYTLPQEPPPIFIAAGGPESAELAGDIGDGLISTAPESQLIDTFRAAGGDDKPCIGQATVCWAQDESTARQIAHQWWRSAIVPGAISQQLPTPSDFEAATKNTRPEEVCEQLTCGPDKHRHLDLIQKYLDAGFDQVYIHQVGPDQEGFFNFYQREILPELRS